MKQWYALRSKPNRESSAAGLLTRAGIESYLPLVQAHKVRGRPPVPEPFFPGYFFSRLDADLGEIRLANYTSGVSYVVGYGSQPCAVPDCMVSSLRERLAQARGLAASDGFQPGDRVLISSGCLDNIEAIFDRQLSASGRVRVFLQMLERLCLAEVHVSQLRPVGR